MKLWQCFSYLFYRNIYSLPRLLLNMKFLLFSWSKTKNKAIWFGRQFIRFISYLKIEMTSVFALKEFFRWTCSMNRTYALIMVWFFPTSSFELVTFSKTTKSVVCICTFVYSICTSDSKSTTSIWEQLSFEHRRFPKNCTTASMPTHSSTVFTISPVTNIIKSDIYDRMRGKVPHLFEVGRHHSGWI